MKDNQSIETQNNILDAAVHYFAKDGYSGASIAKIAKKAGVSKSLIFWYFRNKKKLFENLIERFIENCMYNLSRSNSAGNATTKIENLIKLYWEFITNNWEFVKIFMNWFMQLDTVEKQRTEGLRAIHTKFEQVFMEYIEQGIREGIFSSDLNIPATALSIVSNLEGILVQIFILKTDASRIDENFFHSLKNNIFYGILKRS